MGKLVRDKIPDIIRADGRVAETRILDREEFAEELWAKLREEVQELHDAPSEKVVEEIADVVEVLRAIAGERRISWDVVEATRARKAAARGGFGGRIYLC